MEIQGICNKNQPKKGVRGQGLGAVFRSEATVDEIQALADVLHVRVSDLLVSPLQDEEEAGFVVVVVVVVVVGLGWGRFVMYLIHMIQKIRCQTEKINHGSSI